MTAISSSSTPAHLRPAQGDTAQHGAPAPRTPAQPAMRYEPAPAPRPEPGSSPNADVAHSRVKRGLHLEVKAPHGADIHSKPGGSRQAGEGEGSGSARPGEPQQHSQPRPTIGDGSVPQEINSGGGDFNPQPLNQGASTSQPGPSSGQPNKPVPAPRAPKPTPPRQPHLTELVPLDRARQVLADRGLAFDPPPYMKREVLEKGDPFVSKEKPTEAQRALMESQIDRFEQKIDNNTRYLATLIERGEPAEGLTDLRTAMKNEQKGVSEKNRLARLEPGKGMLSLDMPDTSYLRGTQLPGKWWPKKNEQGEWTMDHLTFNDRSKTIRALEEVKAIKEEKLSAFRNNAKTYVKEFSDQKARLQNELDKMVEGTVRDRVNTDVRFRDTVRNVFLGLTGSGATAGIAALINHWVNGSQPARQTGSGKDTNHQDASHPASKGVHPPEHARDARSLADESTLIARRDEILKLPEAKQVAATEDLVRELSTYEDRPAEFAPADDARMADMIHTFYKKYAT